MNKSWHTSDHIPYALFLVLCSEFFQSLMIAALILPSLFRFLFTSPRMCDRSIVPAHYPHFVCWIKRKMSPPNSFSSRWDVLLPRTMAQIVLKMPRKPNTEVNRIGVNIVPSVIFNGAFIGDKYFVMKPCRDVELIYLVMYTSNPNANYQASLVEWFRFFVCFCFMKMAQKLSEWFSDRRPRRFWECFDV